MCWFQIIIKITQFFGEGIETPQGWIWCGNTMDLVKGVIVCEDWEEEVE
jgi:hypothetical protein